jgi:hypothetical protein
MLDEADLIGAASLYRCPDSFRRYNRIFPDQIVHHVAISRRIELHRFSRYDHRVIGTDNLGVSFDHRIDSVGVFRQRDIFESNCDLCRIDRIGRESRGVPQFAEHVVGPAGREIVGGHEDVGMIHAVDHEGTMRLVRFATRHQKIASADSRRCQRDK